MMLTTSRSKTGRLVLCGLFAALTAVGAFIQIPVPYLDYFTLQFLFVLLAGLLLGSKAGFASVGCYLLIGLCGFPVFAAGGGITYVLRPSFGYLLGFAVTAFVVGRICEVKKPTAFGGYFVACLAGLVVTYGIGLVYKYFMLNFYVGTKTPFAVILLSCFPLDLPGDLVLCALASFLAVRLSAALSRKESAV